MIKNKIKKQIREIIPEERLYWDEPMSRHTSFRIGGPAALLLRADSENELIELIKLFESEPQEYMIAGNGSNLLVSDEGYPGIIIKLGGDFESISQTENDKCLVRAGSAKQISALSVYLAERGLSGLEFASGIPGSLGGAVYMNAGAYGSEIKDVIESVTVMDIAGCRIREISSEGMGFGYRTSLAEEGGIIVLSALLRLIERDPKDIYARIAELTSKRNSKQPLNYPSAGSTFKRPTGGYAAALIEEAGLKGYRIGGAEVSDKHAGFIVNADSASCEDVLAVMRHVRESVEMRTGILLEPEIRLINCRL